MDLSSQPNISFKHHEWSQFCIYADFESSLRPYINVQPNPEEVYTIPKQIPTILIPTVNMWRKPKTRIMLPGFTAADAAQYFMRTIKADVLNIAGILYADRRSVPVLTPDDPLLLVW